MKREVVYSLVNIAKVLCRDQKAYKGDIRNIKYVMRRWIPTKLHLSHYEVTEKQPSFFRQNIS
jgi:hypothetical protein